MPEPVLSVVTGTYQRLPWLQKMVRSTRLSVLPGLPYELVLVDGGSIDGTIEWARGQPDVTLIEQGELLGAVKAFNAGARAARGRYVVMANDDIEFCDLTLTRAVSFMEAHPRVGQGCFYQRRPPFENEWRVEVQMAYREDGRSTATFYGQVAVVPRWLGDKVGWWGDITYTYGGDNQLSSMIMEEGFKVEPVPGCRIRDSCVEDGLRRINARGGKNPQELIRDGEQHPDTAAWLRFWRDRRGPVMRHSRWRQPDLRPLRKVLYLPIFEPGHSFQKGTKRGLHDALVGRGCVVRELDYLDLNVKVGRKAMLDALFYEAEALRPDLCLFQLHGPDPISAGDVWKLREKLPGCAFVNWNGDYHPEQLKTAASLDLAKSFHVHCVVSRSLLPWYRERGMSAAFWQIGIEPQGVGAEPDGDTPEHDILFMGSGYSKARHDLARVLKDVDREAGIYGDGWPKGVSLGRTLYDFKKGCRLYRNAKVSIGDQQWPDQRGYTSNRTFQALAAGGAMFMVQRFTGLEDLGFEDGVHLVAWDDLRDLKKKLQHWLRPERDGDRRRIAAAGQARALRLHSFDQRADELFRIVEMGPNSA